MEPSRRAATSERASKLADARQRELLAAQATVSLQLLEGQGRAAEIDRR